MIRALARDEIERVLQAQAVGRIGCHANGRTYVVPVSYVYDNGAIYAHSADGQKIRMMRRNPNVFFEVEHVRGVPTFSFDLFGLDGVGHFTSPDTETTANNRRATARNR